MFNLEIIRRHILEILLLEEDVCETIKPHNLGKYPTVIFLTKITIKSACILTLRPENWA